VSSIFCLVLRSRTSLSLKIRRAASPVCVLLAACILAGVMFPKGACIERGVVATLLISAFGSYLVSWAITFLAPTSPFAVSFTHYDWVLEFFRSTVCLLCGYVWYFIKFRDESRIICLWRKHGLPYRKLVLACRWCWFVTVVSLAVSTIWVNQWVLPRELQARFESQGGTPRADPWRAFHLPYLVYLPNVLISYALVFPTMFWSSMLAALFELREMSLERAAIPSGIQDRPEGRELRLQRERFGRMFRSQVREAERFALYVLIGVFVLLAPTIIGAAQHLVTGRTSIRDGTGLLPAASKAFYVSQAFLMLPLVPYLLSATLYSQALSKYVWQLDARKASCDSEKLYERFKFTHRRTSRSG
jgi:hypothetical protein